MKHDTCSAWLGTLVKKQLILERSEILRGGVHGNDNALALAGCQSIGFQLNLSLEAAQATGCAAISAHGNEVPCQNSAFDSLLPRLFGVQHLVWRFVQALGDTRVQHTGCCAGCPRHS